MQIVFSGWYPVNDIPLKGLTEWFCVADIATDRPLQKRLHEADALYVAQLLKPITE